jgi:hypothetical protein
MQYQLRNWQCFEGGARVRVACVVCPDCVKGREHVGRVENVGRGGVAWQALRNVEPRVFVFRKSRCVP